MHILQHPSPNWGERPTHSSINTLVLHYTGMQTGKEALHRLCNPEAEVSAHYMIEEDGTIYQLVAEEKRAWHAGLSYWRGSNNINDISIGIELVNPGHEFGYRPFPEAQMAALIPLCQQLTKRYSIPAHNIVAHSDIAPLRKEDPGELFDWQRLAKHGIGLWLDHHFFPADYTPLVLDKQQLLHLQQRFAAFGYKLSSTGIWDAETKAVIIAFKRHFCPYSLDENWCKAAEHVLSSLCKMKN